jgi:putative ABC transport system ATP-binding protein
MIEVKDLRFAWPGGASDCLAIPELRVADGERVFLHGPSGTGKSTLLGLLAGVLVPSAGEVRVLDTALSSLSRSRRDAFRGDHVGYIFQQFNLLPYLDALGNALLPCRFSARRRAQAAGQAGSAQEAAHTLLEEVELPRSMHLRGADALSVGQQQRVAAARALIGHPELVIADEPTSALDAQLRNSFVDLLLARCEANATTLVFVSHDERLAARFDRTIALRDINRVEAHA